MLPTVCLTVGQLFALVFFDGVALSSKKKKSLLDNSSCCLTAQKPIAAKTPLTKAFKTNRILLCENR
jgi:hypothetical protein